MRQRIASFGAALLTFVLLAAALWWITDRPVALRLDADPMKQVQLFAGPGDTVALRGATGPLLAVEAKSGASLGLDASAATVDAATISGFAALGRTVAAGPTPVHWAYYGGGSRAAVTVTTEGPSATVELRPTFPGDSFDLVLAPHGGSLRVDATPVIDGPAKGADFFTGETAPAGHGTAMIPVRLHVPDGTTVIVRMALSDARQGGFTLGPPSAEGTAGVLRLSGVRVFNATGERAAWCGATAGAIAWQVIQPARMTGCLPTLTATRLTPGDGIVIDLAGTGFDGSGSGPPLLQRAKENLLISGLLGVLATAVVLWLVKSFNALFNPASPVASPQTSG